MHRISYLWPLLTFCLLISCHSSRVYEKNYKIPDGIWNRYAPVTFEVPVNDTISAHNIYINVRNTSMYPMRNLFLFVRTTAPSGHSITDTVEIMLADGQGRWYGKGLGDIWDLSQLYKERVRFAQEGNYIFSYEQAMRVENLPFILDVGLRVEKADVK
jgi:gliding motility-associated lipoprotein GldH